MIKKNKAFYSHDRSFVNVLKIIDSIFNVNNIAATLGTLRHV